jgi:hypothetical protein
VEVTEKWIPDQLICRSSKGAYCCPEYMSVSPLSPWIRGLGKENLKACAAGISIKAFLIIFSNQLFCHVFKPLCNDTVKQKISF